MKEPLAHDSLPRPRGKDSNFWLKRIIYAFLIFVVLYFMKNLFIVPEPIHINRQTSSQNEMVDAIYVLAGSLKVLEDGSLDAGIFRVIDYYC